MDVTERPRGAGDDLGGLRLDGMPGPDFLKWMIVFLVVAVSTSPWWIMFVILLGVGGAGR